MPNTPANAIPSLPDLKLATSIKTPLALLALVVLLIGGVTASLSSNIQDDTYRFVAIILGMVILLVMTIGGIVLCYRQMQDEIEKAKKTITEAQRSFAQTVDHYVPQPRRPFGQQKTFLAAPMASLSPDNYERMKEKIRRIKQDLVSNSGQSEVYWGGDAISDMKFFDRPADALAKTLEEIKDCDNFLLVLPDYSCRPTSGDYCKPSSIWWEASMAVTFRKHCTFFVHTSITSPRERMPYYLQAMQANGHPNIIPPAKVWPFSDIDDIQKQIREAGRGIFPQ